MRRYRKREEKKQRQGNHQGNILDLKQNRKKEKNNIRNFPWPKGHECVD